MNPNQDQYSIDYLNQISATPQKRGFDKKFLILIGGGLLLAVVLLIAVAVIGSISQGGASPQKLQTLYVRLETLGTISNEAKKQIKSNSLRATNASLVIFLTDANHDIVDPLGKSGVNVKKIDKSISQKFGGDELKQTLEEARLLATYDVVYAREMNYELETLQLLMKEIYDSTKSKSMKEFITSTDESLVTIRKQLTEFNGSTS